MIKIEKQNIGNVIVIKHGYGAMGKKNYLTQLKFVGFSYSIESWFNIYGKQQYQERHGHHAALLSGMVVLNYDPDQHTAVRFFSPWSEYARVFEKFETQAYGMNFLNDNHGLEMENGYVYIWPSSLNHLVPPQPNKLKDLRITFTFNVNPDNKWNNFVEQSGVTES